MREVISLHLGQAGIQIGNACWELYCLEHGIQPDGQLSTEYTVNSDNNVSNAFFSETSTNKYTARAALIDLEPTVVDQVRTGAYKHLYHPDQLISGKEDAANLFSRGHYTIGKDIAELCLDRIRKLAETCDSLEGFIFYHSIGGGTGSGLGSLLLQKVSKDYDKKFKLGFTIHPSPQISNSVVEPYNALLAMDFLIRYMDSVVMFNNQAIYDICSKHLDIETPSNTNMNRLIAQVSSSLTASIRFGGSLNISIAEFQTNLVPYPKLKFLLASYAPFISIEKDHHRHPSIPQITNSVCDPTSVMTSCDPRNGKYMACSMMYRGDIVPKHVNAAIKSIQNKLQFVDWCPTGFKTSIICQPPVVAPSGDLAKMMRTVCLISNSTAIAKMFAKNNLKFEMLYSKRAFAWWHVAEGGEEYEFHDARTEMMLLEKDYEEVSMRSNREEQEVD